MRAILKSLAFALISAAMFFSFFMMFSIPVLTVLTKLRDPSLQGPTVVVAPTALFRHAGLPLSAAAFAICFVLAWRKYRKRDMQSTVGGQP